VSNPSPQLGPAATYAHDHPPVRDVAAEDARQRSPGQRVADQVAALVGSWPFIIVQSVLLFGWIALNVYLIVYLRTHPGAWKAWDPYPFILLNLVLSFQAAYTGPVVMMSQNRQAQKDRLVSENDFEINRKAEEEIEVVMRHLAHQDRLLLDVIARLEALKTAPSVTELAGKMDEILRRMEANDRRVLSLVAKLGAGE
jgi:Predicted membrane protein